MLEPVRYTNIGDICVTDLIFYDKDIEDKLVKYCCENSISYMPDKDRKSCWRLTDDSFEKLEIPVGFICSPTDLIFSTRTIKRFEETNSDEVMFVVENGFIKGVVHIVDYNNPNLYVELYRMLLKFENNLRTLLIRKDFKNEDVISWFKEKAEQTEAVPAENFYKLSYDKLMEARAVERRRKSNPFQTFFLRDLTEFAVDKGLLDEKYTKPFYIADLRNWIAHSKDITSVNPDDELSVYNMDGLKYFVKLAKSFFRSYDLLEIELSSTLVTYRY